MEKRNRFLFYLTRLRLTRNKTDPISLPGPKRLSFIQSQKVCKIEHKTTITKMCENQALKSFKLT